jgi:hypothetical protein
VVSKNKEIAYISNTQEDHKIHYLPRLMDEKKKENKETKDDDGFKLAVTDS